MTKLHTLYLKKKLLNLSTEKNLAIFDNSSLKANQYHFIFLSAYKNNCKVCFIPSYLVENSWYQSKNNRLIVIIPLKDPENIKSSTSLICLQSRCLGVFLKNVWFFGEKAVVKESKESLKKILFFSLIKKLKRFENS